MKWVDDDSPPSIGTINQIAFEVRDGTADPDDVKAVLALFCQCVKNGSQFPAGLIGYLSDSFARFLQGEKIERALGLKGKRGARKRTEEKDIATALAMLKAQMSGATYETAEYDVGEALERGRSQVADAWRENKQEAFLRLRIELFNEGRGFSEEEKARVIKILGREPWLRVTPNNSKKCAE